jgi:di/tripeptidase
LIPLIAALHPCCFAPQVSYGPTIRGHTRPTIRGAHSPDEKVLISTVAPFFDLTLGILSKLAGRQLH